MKIALDARWVFPQISGIGAYTRELMRRLPRLAPHHEFLYLFDNADMLATLSQEHALAELPNVDCRHIPASLFSIRNQVLLPSWIGRQGVDVFHSTNYMIPLLAFPPHRRGAVACVTTIHDVIPMIFPRHAPRSRKARMYPLYRRLMIEVGRRADRIITDSHVSRHDVIEHLHIPAALADKVSTIYCGVTPPPPGNDDVTPGDERHILYVGRMDPYKNIATLIDAFARIREQVPFPVRLVLAGAEDPRYPQYGEQVRRLGLAEHVTWTGYLSDADLAQTYRRASLLIHPSRYEGFGLQILEAMAVGVPVVSSTGGSLPEVAGDAALLVEPDDTEGFASRAVDILTSPELAAQLRTAGLDRAATFTWDRTAETTLKVYEELGT